MYKYKYKYKYGVPNQGGYGLENDVTVFQGGQTYTVIVYNDGPIITQFRAEYTDKNGKPGATGYTKSILEGQNDVIRVPEGASDVNVRAQIWLPRWGWPPYGWEDIPPVIPTLGAEPACFKAYGNADSPGFAAVDCYSVSRGRGCS
jgi:hypothetical protein